MLVKITKNSIFKNKIQKSLAFLTCFLATFLLCAMLNLTLSISDEVAKELRSYGSNIIVLPKGSSLELEINNQIYEPLKDKSYLEENQLHTIKEIFWRNNITAFAPFLDASVKFNDKNVLITGTYFNKNIKIADEDDFQTGIESLYPLLQIQGSYPKDDSMNEVIVGDEFAKENKLDINDTMILSSKLNTQKVKIVGILSNSKFSNKIIAPLILVQTMLDKPNLFYKAEVSALTIPENDLAQKARRDLSSLNQLEYDSWYCTAYVTSIAYQIEEDFKNSTAKALNQVSDAESLIVKKIQSLMLVTSLICLVVASISIASLISADIHRRKKEIGLLKVLGANIFEIYLIFLSENLIIALIAAIFGFGFGILCSELISLSIFNHFIDISYIVLALSLVFSSFIVTLGCMLALKNIAKLHPAEVLYAR